MLVRETDEQQRIHDDKESLGGSRELRGRGGVYGGGKELLAEMSSVACAAVWPASLGFMRLVEHSAACESAHRQSGSTAVRKRAGHERAHTPHTRPVTGSASLAHAHARAVTNTRSEKQPPTLLKGRGMRGGESIRL